MQWVDSEAPALQGAKVTLTKAALEKNPEDLRLWLTLIRTLIAQAKWAEAVAYAQRARAVNGDLGVLLREQVRAELGGQDFAGALVTARVRAGDALVVPEFEALVGLRDWDAARALAPRVKAIRPRHRELIPLAARGGDPEAVLGLADAVLAQRPWDASAHHYRARALGQLGRIEEAIAAMALDLLPSVTRLADEGDAAAEAAFRNALAADIYANPTLEPDPPGKATRGGQQTERLVHPGNAHLPALRERLKASVARYAAQLPAGHGFSQGAPARVSLIDWAVVYGAGGRQHAHFHPRSWISGVYYVQVPAGEETGALLLGDMEGLSGDPVPWAVRAIQPRAGDLILFPGFTPHATAAANAPGRMVVAFDVRPVGRD